MATVWNTCNVFVTVVQRNQLYYLVQHGESQDFNDISSEVELQPQRGGNLPTLFDQRENREKMLCPEGNMTSFDITLPKSGTVVI